MGISISAIIIILLVSFFFYQIFNAQEIEEDCEFERPPRPMAFEDITLKDYIELSKRTWVKNTLKEDFDHIMLGIMSEIGEIADILKRHRFYGTPLDKNHLKEELGDLLFYVTKLSAETIYEEDHKEEFYLEACGGTFSSTIQKGDVITVLTALSDLDYVEPYLVYLLAEKLEIDFKEVMITNLRKLQVRYPQGFSTDKALNRDLESEKIVIQG